MEKIMKSMLIILVLVLLFCIMMLIRNTIIFDIRNDELRIRGKQSRALIEKRDVDYLKPLADYEDGESYTDMMWDLTKWTRKQFYED